MLVLKISQSIFFYISGLLTSNQGQSAGNGQISTFYSIETLNISNGCISQSKDFFVKPCTSDDSFVSTRDSSKGIKHKTESPLEDMESCVAKKNLAFDPQKRQNNNTIFKNLLEGRSEDGTVSCSSVRQEDVKSTRTEEHSSFARKRKIEENFEMAEVSSTIDENNKKARSAKKSEDFLLYESLEDNKSKESNSQTTANFLLPRGDLVRKETMIVECDISKVAAFEIVDSGDSLKEIDAVSEASFNSLKDSVNTEDATREINDTLVTDSGNLVISADTEDFTRETNNDVAEINPDDLGRHTSTVDSTNKIDGSKIIRPKKFCKRFPANATLDPNDNSERQKLEFFKERERVTLVNLEKRLKNWITTMNGKNNLILYAAPDGWRLSLLDILERVDFNTLMHYESCLNSKFFSLNNIIDTIKRLKKSKYQREETREQLLYNYSIVMGVLIVDNNRVYSYDLELLNAYFGTFDLFNLENVDENVDTYVPIWFDTENGSKVFASIPSELRMRLACLRFLIINEMFQNSEDFLKLVQDFYEKNGF